MNKIVEPGKGRPWDLLVNELDSTLMREIAIENGIVLCRRYDELQAADLLGVSQGSLQRLRKTGQIFYYKKPSL